MYYNIFIFRFARDSQYLKFNSLLFKLKMKSFEICIFFFPLLFSLFQNFSLRLQIGVTYSRETKLDIKKKQFTPHTHQTLHSNMKLYSFHFS